MEARRAGEPEIDETRCSLFPYEYRGRGAGSRAASRLLMLGESLSTRAVVARLRSDGR